MRFVSLPIAGALRLEPEGDADRRGYFTRGYARDALEGRGLDPALVRCDVSVHRDAGDTVDPSLQTGLHADARLVRCTAGAVRVLLVDLRDGDGGDVQKPDDLHDVAVHGEDLHVDGRLALYVPPGVAVGYRTLEYESEVMIQSSEFEHADAHRAIAADAPPLRAAWTSAATPGI